MVYPVINHMKVEYIYFFFLSFSEENSVSFHVDGVVFEYTPKMETNNDLSVTG